MVEGRHSVTGPVQCKLGRGAIKITDVDSIAEAIEETTMTADDFFLLFIAFGGFLIVASVFWTFALVADRMQSKKRGPDIRIDPGAPDNSNDHGQKHAVRSGRRDGVLRRFARRTARCQRDKAASLTAACLAGVSGSKVGRHQGRWRWLLPPVSP
jgi:hypothetical protein